MTSCQVKGAQPNTELVMARQVPLDNAKVRAYRRRRRLDTQRWRSRQRRNVDLYSIECGREEYGLAVQFGGLRDGATDKRVIAVAIGKLLRRALAALLREEAIRRR
jgi:hypothetical protein